MRWSLSSSRAFKKCQRQWFFKNYVAWHNASDPLRREAYILSQLKSLAAWRGSIVDQIISYRVIPALRRNQSLYIATLLQQARSLFDEQFEFAQKRRIREPGMTQEKGGSAYVALYPIEYGLPITDEELSQSWDDIQQALTNLLQMDELLRTVRQASHAIVQRALSFSYNGITIRAVPDAILFFPANPPMIVDWKVHTYAMQNYRLQLATYALALTQGKPHRDFPPSLAQYSPNEICLLEVQLLTTAQRQYTLTETDTEGVYSFIAQTTREMMLAVDAGGAEALTPFDFPVTLDPEECQRCPYRSLCWEQ